MVFEAHSITAARVTLAQRMRLEHSVTIQVRVPDNPALTVLSALDALLEVRPVDPVEAAWLTSFDNDGPYAGVAVMRLVYWTEA